MRVTKGQVKFPEDLKQNTKQGKFISLQNGNNHKGVISLMKQENSMKNNVNYDQIAQITQNYINRDRFYGGQACIINNSKANTKVNSKLQQNSLNIDNPSPKVIGYYNDLSLDSKSKKQSFLPKKAMLTNNINSLAYQQQEQIYNKSHSLQSASVSTRLKRQSTAMKQLGHILNKDIIQIQDAKLKLQQTNSNVSNVPNKSITNKELIKIQHTKSKNDKNQHQISSLIKKLNIAQNQQSYKQYQAITDQTFALKDSLPKVNNDKKQQSFESLLIKTQKLTAKKVNTLVDKQQEGESNLKLFVSQVGNNNDLASSPSLALSQQNTPSIQSSNGFQSSDQQRLKLLKRHSNSAQKDSLLKPDIEQQSEKRDARKYQKENVIEGTFVDLKTIYSPTKMQEIQTTSKFNHIKAKRNYSSDAKPMSLQLQTQLSNTKIINDDNYSVDENKQLQSSKLQQQQSSEMQTKQILSLVTPQFQHHLSYEVKIKQLLVSLKRNKKYCVTNHASLQNLFPILDSKTINPSDYYHNKLSAHQIFTKNELSYRSQLYREHFIQSYHAAQLCKVLPPSDPTVIMQKQVNLPKHVSLSNKKTLVFDLDETLVHCNERLNMECDHRVNVVFPNGESCEAGINIRPYAIELLEELSKHFEIIVFTASHPCYAQPVIDCLDPAGRLIHHRLFRDSCVQTKEGLHLKDLRVLNRNLKDVCLIDNATYSFCLQIHNGVPCIPFYNDKSDTELKELLPYLKQFLHADIQTVNAQMFKLHHFQNFASPAQCFQFLYNKEFINYKESF